MTFKPISFRELSIMVTFFRAVLLGGFILSFGNACVSPEVLRDTANDPVDSLVEIPETNATDPDPASGSRGDRGKRDPGDRGAGSGNGRGDGGDDRNGPHDGDGAGGDRNNRGDGGEDDPQTPPVAGGGSGESPPDSISVPEEIEVGPITIWVDRPEGQSATVTLSNGAVITENQFGQPLQNGLAMAIRNAQPGDVIGISGRLPRVEIGKTNPSKNFSAYWENGAVIKDLTIVSTDPANPAIIESLFFLGDYTEEGAGGVDNILFKDVHITNGSSAAAPVVIGDKMGMLRFYDVRFYGEDETKYNGYGMKWGLRAGSGGKAKYDIRRLVCESAQEHCLYIDSPGYENTDFTVIDDVQQVEPSGRTGIQIVNRADPSLAVGLSGKGDMVIRGARLWTEKGQGGSGLTIAGHLGRVLVEDYHYKGDLGALVVYSDENKGLFLNENGFTTTLLFLKDIFVDSPNADRAHVTLAGVEKIRVFDFEIKGNKTAFELFTKYSGPIDNGEVYFHVGASPSQYSGFQTPHKVKHQNHVLTDRELDGLVP